MITKVVVLINFLLVIKLKNKFNVEIQYYKVEQNVIMMYQQINISVEILNVLMKHLHK